VRINGHEEVDPDLPIEQVRFYELAEVTLSASPAELRRMAAFFAHSADEMERMGSAYDHLHLSDEQSGFEDSPHFVVVRAESHT
jgi:hypothetical protein